MYRVFLLGLLLLLGETVNFHAQVITRLLPENFAVGNVKEIVLTDFVTTENKRTPVKQTNSQQ